MSEENFLNDLVSCLKGFIPGDLVQAMQIKELLESNKEFFPETARAQLLDLSTVFQCLILEGENDDLCRKYNELNHYILEELEKPNKKTSDKKEIKKEDSLNLNDILIDDDEVLNSFIQEAHDHLDTIEERILVLENDASADLINGIFRSIHTIKGVSSFIGLDSINKVSHSLETLLDQLRVGELEIDSNLISILLDGTDILVNMVNYIEEEAQLRGEGRHSFRIREPDIEYNNLIEKINNIKVPESGVNQKMEPDSKRIESSIDDLITDDMISKFIEESIDLLDSTEHSVLELENSSDISNAVGLAFRNIHTIKGNSGFFGFGQIEQLSMDIESMLDLIRKGEKEVNHGNITKIFHIIDLIRSLLHQLIDSGKEGEIYDEYKPLGEVLVDMGVSKEKIEYAAELQQKKLGEILVDEGVVSDKLIHKALKSQNKADTSISSLLLKRKDIRIDMEKLDRLFDIVGELITAESMVVDSADLAGLELRDFNKSALYLSKITREIQSITMSMRMIPLEGLFNKMKRLVRDLSRKIDKPVNFRISGADTEMDKNVIEEIADPLVHIIRNSIDHGLEDKERRSDSGKDLIGTVDLNARYEGNEIWITVKDDGAGLDSGKILKSAISKGLIVGDPDILEDEEIWNLIFEPGFSTADKVSEISGRGVGMDVVKRNIEKLRGRIAIRSENGKGTEIILKIPLTLAIIEAITNRVGHLTMAIQSSDVIEFLKPTKKLFTETGKSKIVINLRDEIIPVIDLNHFYKITNNRKKLEDGIIIVVSAGGVKAALVVDEILGSKQVVVKALPSMLDSSRAISGCSLMGNGDVCLILDASAIIKEIFE